MKLFIIIIICILFPNFSYAKRLNSESFYQKKYCSGILEYQLSDKTRIDCLTKDYAVEYDFANKWAEAIGQSLHYARMTNKKAGIVLILENEIDIKYYQILIDNIKAYKLPIEVWLVAY